MNELGLAPPSPTATEPADLPIARSYATLAQLAPVILENFGRGKTAGVLVVTDEPPQRITVGDYVLEVSYPRNRMPPAPASTPPPAPVPPAHSGALFIALGPDEYLATGSGPVNVAFSPNTPEVPMADILSIDEGTYLDGRWVPGRRLNGDENGQIGV